jgi:predicted pyridoxine 5'-phosphate oxidase superfamily flavin-nucleotide-binding protein
MQARQPDGSVWHAGELAVQRRAGVAEVAHRAQAGIHDSIPESAARFLQGQQFAVFGSVDHDGGVWASIRTGKPGFVRADNPHTVQTAPLHVPGDPLIENLRGNPDVGMLVMDFATRRRMRLNGEAEIMPDASLRIHARQVYANCPQYIQQRVAEETNPPSAGTAPASRATRLSPEQQRWIAAADTFFIASAHPEYGVDASHRGGNPGFVKVENVGSLLIPDYSGNNMFNTLGNISVNPRAGLAFPDFEQGRILQLSGGATILWDSERQAEFPGAKRLLSFAVDEVIEIRYAQLARYAFMSYSPFNPA